MGERTIEDLEFEMEFPENVEIISEIDALISIKTKLGLLDRDYKIIEK